ncbi:MAG: hypothetical protein ABWY11_26980 [Umezawaea sp.]
MPTLPERLVDFAGSAFPRAAEVTAAEPRAPGFIRVELRSDASRDADRVPVSVPASGARPGGVERRGGQDGRLPAAAGRRPRGGAGWAVGRTGLDWGAAAGPGAVTGS